MDSVPELILSTPRPFVIIPPSVSGCDRPLLSIVYSYCKTITLEVKSNDTFDNVKAKIQDMGFFPTIYHDNYQEILDARRLPSGSPSI